MTISFSERLAVWYEMEINLGLLKAQEMTLRKELFAEAFPTPKEGTNKFSLPDGYVLDGQYKLDRKIDVAAYTQLLPKLREAKIPVDKLLKWTPNLVISEYRTLDKESLHFFDQCLIIKPGAPAMEIVKPKKK